MYFRWRLFFAITFLFGVCSVMRIITVFCLFLGLCFITPAHATSSITAEWEGIRARAGARAQKVIDACWAISQEDRDSGVTSRMREGGLKSALCLQEHIIMLAKTELFTESPEISEQIEQKFHNLHAAYASFYWDLYNSIDPCSAWCGTENHVVHNGEYAHLLEKIVRDVYQQMERYKDYKRQ